MGIATPGRVPGRSLRRSALGLLLIAICAIGAAVGAATASANTTGYFCPSNGTTIALGPYPDRCVGPYHTTIVGLGFDDAYTPVRKCVVVKPNADGSGGNIGPASCPLDNSAAVVAFSNPGVAGYPTGINNSSNYHTGFYGVITLYN